jgi:hypothetical protein
LKLPKVEKSESTTVVDLEGSYVAIDHDDLRSCIDGRNKDFIAVVDHEVAPRSGDRQTRRIAGPELARRIIFLEQAAISTTFR